MTINREAWLKAVASLMPPTDESAVTSAEFAEMLGLQISAAKARMKKLVVSGAATVTFKHILDSAGRPQRVRAYTLTVTESREAHGPYGARPRRRRQP